MYRKGKQFLTFGKDPGDESFIVLPDLFGIHKAIISIKIHSCEFNEIKSKHFWKKLHKFTNDNVEN